MVWQLAEALIYAADMWFIINEFITFNFGLVALLYIQLDSLFLIFIDDIFDPLNITYRISGFMDIIKISVAYYNTEI